MKIVFTTMLLLLGEPLVAQAAPPEVRENLGNVELKGSATASILTKEIYDAELWAQKTTPFTLNQDFALSLTYKTRFKASLLAWATVHEIARIEGVKKNTFDDLEIKFKKCFSDVKLGDRITGLSTDADQVTYFTNGKKQCVLSYPNITQRFFGIWLGPNTRDPIVSAKLKGMN